MDQNKMESCEPHYFIGLVVRGTEKQYTRLLEYLGGRNGAHVVYQCKSLTYLRVSRDDPVKLQANPSAVAKEAVQDGLKK